MNMEYLDRNLKMDGKRVADEWLSHGCHGKLYDLNIPCKYVYTVIFEDSHSSEQDTQEHGRIFKSLKLFLTMLIIGYKRNTVNMLRLWKSQASEVFSGCI